MGNALVNSVSKGFQFMNLLISSFPGPLYALFWMMWGVVALKSMVTAIQWISDHMGGGSH